MKHPVDFMPNECFSKAYWHYIQHHWIDWLSSFKTLPIKEYNDHIGNIIDMYLPGELNFKLIYEE